MHTEIFIEGYLADITADIQALITYAVDDVADFSSRNTSFSKTLTFPGSSTNNLLFGNAFEFTAYNRYRPSQPNIGANFNAAKAARCLVLIHGIQVFKGIIRLMKINIRGQQIEYEAAIFGELGGLISAIGNKLLTGNADTAEDLDFSAYDGTWTLSHIIGSWNAYTFGPTGVGVFYPLIDYGQVSTTKQHYKFTAMRPALHVKEYIEKIFAKAGYTYTCPFFNTNPFLRLIIPHNEDQLYRLAFTLVDYSSTGHWPFVIGNSSPQPNVFNSDVLLTDAHTLNTNQFSAGTTSTGSQFTFLGTNGTRVNIAGDFYLALNGGGGLVNVNLSIRVNGVVQATQTVTLNGSSTYTPGFTNQTLVNLSLAANGVSLNSGDNVVLHGEAVYPGTAPSTRWEVIVKAGMGSRIQITSTAGVPVPAVYNDWLQMSSLIPKGILQKDFLLSICKMFNLYIIEDTQVEKHLNILPFPDFYDNSNPVDWTGKVDRSQEITLTPMSEVNARYFNFLYAEDSDYFNDLYRKRNNAGYGDRSFDAGLDFVKEKADLKLIFAPSPLVGQPTNGYGGRDKYVTAIYKFGTSGEEPIASKIRILQAGKKSATTWSILDGAGNAIGSTNIYGYAGHVDDPITPQGADLNFGAPVEIYWRPTNPYTAPNLFNAFYSAYMSEITDKDSKLLTCFVRLTEIDIASLDFKKAVVIDGQLWRLQKAVDYDAAEENVTKTELLKVINISY